MRRKSPAQAGDLNLPDPGARFYGASAGGISMIRPELHPQRRAPDALSRPPARPRLDAVAWNAAHALDRNIALLREKLAEANREPQEIRQEIRKDGKAA